MFVACTAPSRANNARTVLVSRVPPKPAHHVIPDPVSVQLAATDSFAIDSSTLILVDAAASAEAERVARWLADVIAMRKSARPRRMAPSERLPARSIYLHLAPDDTAIAPEGYELTIERDQVRIEARQAAGLFYGSQTLRQLLPTVVEHPSAQHRTLKLPRGMIKDAPRYPVRGLLLDVARHFLPDQEIKRYIDLMALYKLNVLHLHLTDDQGWRLEIKSHPLLTAVGARTEVGGRPSGFYTQELYRGIVAYAAERFITVVPEIDVPGHINAALVAYPELTCDGVAPPPYFAQGYGFSALCVDRENVYDFVDDVMREVAQLTPGPWLHIGGDEVKTLTAAQYAKFVERAERIVSRHGKRMVGWAEIAPAALGRETIVQKWNNRSVAAHVARGGQIILSPVKRAYLDMKYDSTTMIGFDWAALIEVRDSYDWDPATFAEVPSAAVLGVEAALWSETVGTRGEWDYMAFPRLAALAEVAWSPQTARRWEDFRERLAAHGPRLTALGVNFYRSPQVPWQR